MSTLQQRPYSGRIGRAPQPHEASDGEHDSSDRPDTTRHAPRRAIDAGALARYGSLVLLVVVLLAGYWKPHPLPSLALPVVALLWWWPAIRDRQPERWLLFYVGGIYLYTVLRAFADDAGMAIRAEYVIAIDRVLFMGNVPTVELQRAFFTPLQVDFIDVLAVATHWSFFIVPHAVFVFLWFRRRALAPMYAGAMLITLYLGLLLFWLAPTVPPWLAARQGDLAGTYRVMNFVTHGLDMAAYRELYATMAGPNAVASVPSIHMALTFLVLLAVRDVAPRWTLPLVGYNVAMGFSLVYLGEHYVFDLLVGVLVAAVGHYALRTRLPRPSPPGPPAMRPRRRVLAPATVSIAAEGDQFYQLL